MFEDIMSDKFNQVEKIRHLTNLKKAIQFKITLMKKSKSKSLKRPNFDYLAPKKIEYLYEVQQRNYSSEFGLADLDNPKLVIIDLLKSKSGKYKFLKSRSTISD